MTVWNFLKQYPTHNPTEQSGHHVRIFVPAKFPPLFAHTAHRILFLLGTQSKKCFVHLSTPIRPRFDLPSLKFPRTLLLFLFEPASGPFSFGSRMKTCSRCKHWLKIYVICSVAGNATIFDLTFTKTLTGVGGWGGLSPPPRLLQN